VSKSLFRLTVKSDGSVVPAFAPREDVSSFEEAYESFTFRDEADLFADLIVFNQMTFLFADFVIPGFDPSAHDRHSRDIAVTGSVQDDGSLLLEDGRVIEADAVWQSHAMTVPTFSGFAI
jgi:hypothetical protein